MTLLDEQIEQYISKLVSDKCRFLTKDVEEYWTSLGLHLDNPTWLRILNRLVDVDVFRWLDFVAHKLPEIASTSDDFIAFIVKLTRKIGNDMSGSMISTALINIGENEPELGHALFERMISADGKLAYTAGFVLGGVGAKEPNKVIEAAECALAGGNPFLRACIIRSLGITLRSQEKINKSSQIFRIIKRLSWQTEEKIAQIELVRLYFELDRFDPRTSNKHLMRMAELGTPEIRSAIARYLIPYRLSYSGVEMKLIELCSHEEQEYVLSELVLPLAQIGRRFPEESLAIVHRWIKEDKYFKIRSIDWLLQEIGKGDLVKCIQTVEYWIKDENEERFLFFVPIVLGEMCKSNYLELLNFLENWHKIDDKFLRIMLKTMKEVLTYAYDKEDYGPLVDKSLFLLQLIAQRRGVDYDKIIKGETDEIFQCLRIAEELGFERPALDYKVIQGNIKKYPRLEEFLGVKWLRDAEMRVDMTHPLLTYLSRSKPDFGNVFLTHLDGLMINISPREKGASNLKGGLRNEDEFWQTVSEIEITGTLRRRCQVEIEPEVNGKYLDLRVRLDHQEILIEVINPDKFKPLRFLARAVVIPNRARGKIFEEFKRHIEPVKDKINLPVIIVLDVGRSEINHRSVEDYLDGTPQFTLVRRKDTGEIVRTYESRAEDSMSQLQPSMNLISAIMCYRTALSNDGKLNFEVWIMENNSATRPLDRTHIDALIGAFN